MYNKEVNTERKELQVKIDANYKRYLELQYKLSAKGCGLSAELLKVYHEISDLRYDAGAAMVREVYELND